MWSAAIPIYLSVIVANMCESSEIHDLKIFDLRHFDVRLVIYQTVIDEIFVIELV